MVNINETFFTVIGCMDGRCQEAVARYGRQRFSADYPDTITEAGIVGQLTKNPSEELLRSLRNKINISLEKHHSKGIVVSGHAECAGNPVLEDAHKDDVRKTVTIVSQMINNAVPVVGVFVKRSPTNPEQWEVEEVPQTVPA